MLGGRLLYEKVRNSPKLIYFRRFGNKNGPEAVLLVAAYLTRRFLLEEHNSGFEDTEVLR